MDNEKIKNAMIEASRKVCYQVGYDKCKEDILKIISKMPFVKIDKKGNKYVVITNTIDKNKLEEKILELNKNKKGKNKNG